MFTPSSQGLASEIFSSEMDYLLLWEDALSRSSKEFSVALSNPTYVLSNKNDVLRDFNTLDQRVLAQSGNDTIILGAGADVVEGGAGNDTIYGGAGDDLILGGGNDDVLYGQDGNDILFGGVGNDTLRGQNGDDFLYGENGNDNLSGNNGDDFLSGGKGNDKLNGGGGHDVLFGQDGNDQLIAGAGNDLMMGGDGNDLLYGGGGDDIIMGGKGDDVLAANAGSDTLNGGEGADRLFGGPGADSFIFDDAKSTDTITNFNVSEGDSIDISDVLSYDPLIDDIADFISSTDDGQNTTLNIDANGTAGAQKFDSLVVLDGITNLDLDMMIANQNLIVA